MGDAASQHQQEVDQDVAASGLGKVPISPVAAAAAAAAAAANGAAPGGATPGSNGQSQSGVHCDESVLLSQLVQTLGQRQRHSLLLSDLGALLPGPLRHGVKEKGGLRSWLQKYPQLFQVSGQPGKESVTLTLLQGAGTEAGAEAPAGAAADEGRRGSEPNAADAGRSGEAKAVSELDQRKKEEDEANESAVQLRGLPYRATVSDIKAFLKEHAANLKDDNSIQLVLNRDGRPSGFARVQFTTPAAARGARDALHMQVMEVAAGKDQAAQGGQSQDRYVEIFLFAERPNKLRFKKTAAADGTTDNAEEDIEALGITKKHVLDECRAHMRSPGKGQLLLSMLGVALSQGARLYLKKTDQGLKHFLAQHPNEFSVDGPKGRECISYLPALQDGGQHNRDLPANFPDSKAQKNQRRDTNTGGPATGSISDIPHDNARTAPSAGHDVAVPMSPKVMSHFHPMHGTPAGNTATPNGRPTPGWDAAPTPSDWGTPKDQLFRGYVDTRNHPRPPVDPNVAARDGAAPGGPFNAGYNNWSAWAMPPPNYWSGPPGVPMNPFFAAGAPPAVWGQGPEGQQDQQGIPDVNLGPPAWERAGAPMPFGAADPMPFGSAAGMPPSVGTGPAPASGTAPAAMNAAGAPMPIDAVMAALAQQKGGMPGGLPQPPAPQHSGPKAAVRLRGLPFNSTEQDVYAFFGKHDVVERVAEGRNAVRMIMKKSGKPSGEAVVMLCSPNDIPVVKQVLDRQSIGSRYIEVLPHREEDDGSASKIAQHAGHAEAQAMAQATPNFFDQAGDTGGSGGCFRQWERHYMDMPGLGPGGPAPLPFGAPPGVNQSAPGGLPIGAEAQGAGTGGDSGSAEETRQEAGQWEALFGFLKHSNEEPPMPPGSAALHSLGGVPGMGLPDQSVRVDTK